MAAAQSSFEELSHWTVPEEKYTTTTGNNLNVIGTRADMRNALEPRMRMLYFLLSFGRAAVTQTLLLLLGGLPPSWCAMFPTTDSFIGKRETRLDQQLFYTGEHGGILSTGDDDDDDFIWSGEFVLSCMDTFHGQQDARIRAIGEVFEWANI